MIGRCATAGRSNRNWHRSGARNRLQTPGAVLIGTAKCAAKRLIYRQMPS
jgi:hypothetical protein